MVLEGIDDIERVETSGTIGKKYKDRVCGPIASQTITGGIARGILIDIRQSTLGRLLTTSARSE